MEKGMLGIDLKYRSYFNFFSFFPTESACFKRKMAKYSDT